MTSTPVIVWGAVESGRREHAFDAYPTESWWPMHLPRPPKSLCNQARSPSKELQAADSLVPRCVRCQALALQYISTGRASAVMEAPLPPPCPAWCFTGPHTNYNGHALVHTGKQWIMSALDYQVDITQTWTRHRGWHTPTVRVWRVGHPLEATIQLKTPGEVKLMADLVGPGAGTARLRACLYEMAARLAEISARTSERQA